MTNCIVQFKMLPPVCTCLGFAVVMLLIWIWYYFRRVYRGPINSFLLRGRFILGEGKGEALVWLLETSTVLAGGQSSTLKHMNVTRRIMCPGHREHLQPWTLITRSGDNRGDTWFQLITSQPETNNSQGASWRRHDNVLFAYESQQNRIIYPINMA